MPSHAPILMRGDTFKASKVIQESVLNDPKIDVHFSTEVSEFRGAKSKLNALLTRDLRTGQEAELVVDGAFVFIGLDPNTAFLRDSGVRLNPWGFIVTGHDLLHEAIAHLVSPSESRRLWRPACPASLPPVMYARAGPTVASATGRAPPPRC